MPPVRGRAFEPVAVAKSGLLPRQLSRQHASCRIQEWPATSP
jgi:hypothetical protein